MIEVEKNRRKVRFALVSCHHAGAHRLVRDKSSIDIDTICLATTGFTTCLRTAQRNEIVQKVHVLVLMELELTRKAAVNVTTTQRATSRVSPFIADLRCSRSLYWSNFPSDNLLKLDRFGP